MSQRLSNLCIYLLYLQATAGRLEALATEVSRGARQYSANATHLVSSENLESPFPYYFPDLTNMENLFPMLDCHGVVLEEATVDQLQDAMNMGQLTSTTIALCYLQRIYQTDEYTKYA